MAWASATTKSGTPSETLALTTSAQTAFTAPAASGNITNGSATAKLVEIVITNTNASGTPSFTVYKVPSGGTAGTGNEIYAGAFTNSPDTKVIPIDTYLAAGDTIQALASTTGLNITVSADVFA